MQRTSSPASPRRLLAGAALAVLAALLSTRPAGAQSFTPGVSPGTLTLELGGGPGTITVTTVPDPGFVSTILYSVVGLPAFIQTGGGQVAFPPTYAPLVFTVSLGAGAVPGTYTGAVQGLAGPPVTVPFTVVVTAPPPPGPPPSFTAVASPDPLRMAPGTRPSVVVTTEADPGFSLPITYAFASLPAFVHPSGMRTATAPGYAPVEFTFTLGTGAAPGTYRGTLRGSAGPMVRQWPFTVVVAPAPPAPGFRAAASPNPVTLTIGSEGAPVTVTTTADPGLAAPVTYGLAGFPAFVEVTGDGVARPPAWTPVALVVSLGPSAAPGSYEGVLRGAGGGVASETPFRVVVVQAAAAGPLIDAVVPDAVVAGATGQVVQLRGHGFAAGATITSDSPVVTVTAAQVVSPQLAVLTLETRRDAAGRQVRLRLANPGGPATADGGRLRLLAPSALEAPLTVTGTAVLLPRPGTQIAAGDEVRAHGLLATSGTGAVFGSWALDGVPFDRFVVQAIAGQPVALASRVPLPQLARGTHSLTLVIDRPQRLTSPAVIVVETVEAAARLRALAPAEGVVLRGRPLTLRWSLVPGATAYEVELQTAGGTATRQARVTAPLWRLADADREALGEGAWLWRVRPVLPGEARGEPTPWRTFTLLPASVRLILEPPEAPRSDGVALRWSGGAPGLVYRVVLVAANGKERHSALAGDASYVLPRHGPRPQRGDRLKVEAFDSEGQRAGESGTVAADAPAGEAPPAADATAEDGAAARLLHSELEVEATANHAGGDAPTSDTAGLTLSGQATRTRARGEAAATADVSWGRDLAAGGAPTERLESWVARAAGEVGGASGELRAGIATPSFLDGLELLGAGLARTGAEAEACAGRGLRAAYYSTFDAPAIAASSGGSLGPMDELRAASLELGGDNGPLVLRALALEVEEPASPLGQGGSGRTYGLFGRVGPASGLHLLLEGAHGELDPAPGGFDERQEGIAWRLGLERPGGRLSWRLALRHVEAGFANPADRGVSAGGLAGRDSFELSATGTVGPATLALGLQAIDGDAPGGAPARVRGATLSLNAPMGGHVLLGLNGNAATTRADADVAAFAPAAERVDWGVGATLTESLGSLQLSQTASLAVHGDRREPFFDTRATAVAWSAVGALGGGGTLAATLAGNRLEADRSLGRTDTWTASLQPSWELRRAALRLQPYYAYNRTRNRAMGLDSTSEQIHGGIGWSPPWLRPLLALDLAADWVRQRSGEATSSKGFVARYTASLVLRFGRPLPAGSASGAVTSAPPPGPTMGPDLPRALPSAR